MSNAQSHKTITLGEHLFTPSPSIAKKLETEPYPQFTTLIGRTYCTMDEVAHLVDKLRLDEYEYILHDKDVNEDGSPKEPHVHFIFKREKRIRLTEFFKLKSNTYIELPRNVSDAEKYLVHENAPKKHQYSRKEIVEFHANGINTLALTKQELAEKRNESFLDDLGALTRRELAYKYGMDYMKNYQRYEAFSRVVEYDETIKHIDEDSDALNSYMELSSDDSLLRCAFRDAILKMFEDNYNLDHFPNHSELTHWYGQLLDLYRASCRVAFEKFNEGVQ